jgi:hypothetical protein
MPQNTNLNNNTYNDDFDASKSFYRVLFRPGYSIQTRELNNLQSILQNQIESFGKHTFKQGDLVVPGEVSYNNKLDYVKLSSVSEVAVNINGIITFKKYDISLLRNATLVGSTSGVQATVITTEYGNDLESDILYVKYLTSGNSNNEETFRQGETLEVVGISDSPTLVVGTDGSALPNRIKTLNYDTKIITEIDSPAMGFASAVQVQQGVYFINGFFVTNSEQLIVVDKYYNLPSVKVGFIISESVTTPDEDPSLYDNARGFSNESAPGAHRLKIDLSLTVYQYDDSLDSNFIQLVSIKNGNIEKLIQKQDYSLIEETLARRTYDESGDYVVENFPLDLRDYYKKNNNGGIYPLNTETNLVSGPTDPETGRQITKTVDEASQLMVAGIGAGKAYVKGYEIVNKNTKYIEVSKARDTLKREDNRIKINPLSSYKITNVFNSIPLNSEGEDLTAYPTIYLNSVFNDGSLGFNSTESLTDGEKDKQTLIRRGKYFSPDIGVMTVYLKKEHPVVGFPSNGDFGLVGGNFEKFWYIQSKQTTSTDTLVGSVDLLSYSIVARPDIADSVDEDGEYNQLFLELTIAGNKSDLQKLIKEYDESDTTKRRRFFLNQTDARAYSFQTTTPQTIFAYGYVVDYNPVITPIVGVAKPKDFKFVKSGVGFNPDSDIVLSKGRSSANGGLTSIVVTNRGNNYSSSNPPSISFTGGGGVNAAAEAIILDGSIVSLNITNPGSGYITAPQISITGGSGSGCVATALLSQPTYNTTFQLAYFNPIFFTKIIVDQSITADIFKPGKYVLGLSSGAYGIIEGSSSYGFSSVDTLFVRTLSGQFRPGETITDEIGNARRIARENTLSHIIVKERGGGYSSTSKVLLNGVEYSESAIKINLLGSSIYKIDITDRNLVSSTYDSPPIIGINSSTSPTTFAKLTPVLYRNTVINYSGENVKSIHSVFGVGNRNIFTCDVVNQDSSFFNSKTLTDFTFFGNTGSQYLECSGFSGNPTSDLIQGDVIQFTDKNNKLVRSIVQYVTTPGSLTRSRVYLDGVLTEDVTASNVIRIRPKIDNATNSSLIIPTGAKNLKSIEETSADSKIKYYFRRDFVTTASTSGGNITFAAQLPFGTQRFVSFSQEAFILTVLEKRSATTVETGDIIFLTNDKVNIVNSTDDSTGLTAGSVTVSLPSNFFGTTTNFPKIKLSATVEVSKARSRLKTSVQNKRIVIVSPGDRVIPLRGYDYDTDSNDIISYSDAYVIKNIFEGSLTSPPSVDSAGNLVSGIDVTNRFTFDDGQRDTLYDVSRIILKPGFDSPDGQLLVVFDYFEHSQGDFCTIDSYTHEAGLPLDEIPYFNSTVYGRVSLRDVIDFRPKVDSTAIISGYQDTSILSVEDSTSFIRSGGISSSSPAIDSNIEYTISFNTNQYLDRIDGVYLNKKGSFFVKEGNSSLNPTKPSDVEDSIPLYYAYIPAYTLSPSDVRVISVDNRRYTMRDIGKLEKRVERLEEYTMLSLLEQQALNMQIKDELGLDRFKSGFAVDNFQNHAFGNIASSSYNCSIDTQQSVLRPTSKETSLKLTEVNTRNDQRFFNAYQKSGDVLTLPYTDLSFIGNNFATTTTNINPFVVLQYVGDAFLSPSVDQWYDERTQPIILDNDSKVFSVFYSKTDSRFGYESLFNNFIINWIGTDRVFYNTSALTSLSKETSLANTVAATVATSSNISPQNNESGKGTGKSFINPICRTNTVFFTLRRMKPNTQFFVFMDNKNIDRWVAQDYYFTGIGGNSVGPFANIDRPSITTDANGNASGLIIIPNGLPPQPLSTWSGTLDSVIYDTSEQTGVPNSLKFTTGIKTIKFTSSLDGKSDSSAVSYSEVNYYATGSLPEQPSSIVSTYPSKFRSDEGVQTTGGSSVKPNPISQSFTVENTPGGVFITGLNLFFNKKSNSIPVKVYLTNIETGKPGNYIIPGSETILLPDTYIKIYTNGVLKITKNENAVGQVSGASGPVKTIIDRNGAELPVDTQNRFTLSNDQVYTLVLSNHNGVEFKENENLLFASLTSFNATSNTDLRITIAKNSGRITGLYIKNMGSGYETANLTIESPQLPGGSVSTATAKVYSGNIFDCSLIVNGSGYTEAPSVIITGTGTAPSGAVIESILTIDTPSVRMGVAVDPGASITTDSTTPTKFKFEYPVYLQNNTEYAFVIESDSIDYSVWTSKLGETEVATNSAVTSQPLLGSVFRSQNINTWVEDIFEDIKFTLYRAQFDTSKNAIIELTNEDLGYELLDANPVETDSSASTNATSELFKNNKSIIKINHRHNGFEDSGKSYVTFKNAETISGISDTYLNNAYFEIYNSGINFYNIKSEIPATSTLVGGGKTVKSTHNKKFEKSYAQVGFLTFDNTNITTKIKTTNIKPVDSNDVTYTTYSQSTFDNGYEKTFLNEEHYFDNQKVVMSRLNELKNTSVSERSLSYKIEMSSESSYLSPVIDLRLCSVKLVNNIVEKAVGYENRFGRRDQVLKFYPVYRFQIASDTPINIDVGNPSVPAIVTGFTSKAVGTIVRYDAGQLYVKMSTDTLFQPSETLVFRNSPTETSIRVGSSSPIEVIPSFITDTNVVVIEKTDVTKKYTGLIEGKVITWDVSKRELTVSNNKKPLNDNYTSASTFGSIYARKDTSIATQEADIFRIGDLLSYQGIVSGTEAFYEVKEVNYTYGVSFVPNTSTNNTSSLAEYTTKEIVIDNASTSIDVRLTANIFASDDVMVYYKTKDISSQYNFDDLEWIPFNTNGESDTFILPSSDNSIAPYIESQSSYKEYKYSIFGLNEFSSYGIKIVMRSSQPVYVPKVQDIRIVASY